MRPEDIGILIVDDEASVRDSLAKWFRLDGYRVDSAGNANEALGRLQDEKWDIVLLDIMMPGMDGLELQKRIRQIDKDIVTIIITAFASVDTSIRALKEGAFDYIVKPVDPDNISHLIRNAVEQKKLKNENLQLKRQIEEIALTDEIIGESPVMKKVIENLHAVAQTDSTVMITGENGTGKELIAHAIHSAGSRRYFPFVTINCGVFKEGLLESEIFGHEKGAFPGALYSRRGRLEMADKGTLFIDEINSVGEKTQMDLMRLIETRSFTRLGGNKAISADFRIICASGSDLEEAVQEGGFNRDLYYRLNVFKITVPPLRDRKLDIPLLARFFVKKFSASMNKKISGITQDSLDILLEYDWPGNVRELRNVIERAVVASTKDIIELDAGSFIFNSGSADIKEKSLEDVEKEHIGKILDITGWNIAQASSVLKISRLTLYNKIEKYGFKKSD